MKIAQSYRFRIYPTKAQEEAFRQISGCCRLVYNLGLEQRRDHWRRFRAISGRPVSSISQINELPALKAEFPFLKGVPSHCLQQALKDLDRAYRNFFEGRAGYPRPRRKFDHDSFRFPDPKQFHLTRAWLHVPKFGRQKGDNGRIRVLCHRKVRGQIKTITIIRSGSNWYACLSTVREVSDQPRKTRGLSVVGIDRGVTIPVALSTGQVLGREVETKGHLRRQKRLQQSLARKKKGSSNRARAAEKLRGFKARQSRRRKDSLHKLSAQIVKSHDVSVLEGLNIQNMTKSARGTESDPGVNVAQKAGLNRAILDKGWGMFAEMLAYKAGWAGKRVIRVPAHHTSQTCIACGHVSKENRKTQAEFCCVSCGHQENADIHAAREIRRRGVEILTAEGLSVLQPVESSALASLRSRKKPAEAGQDQTSETDCRPAA